MEYAPPTFSFTGLQFNPDIFENPIVDNIVPDPLPIGELNTNNIQALNDADPVTLYTTLANYLTLGSSTMTELNLNGFLMNIRSYGVFFSDFLDTCKIVLATATNQATINFYPETISGFQSGSIIATPAVTPTADDQGTLQITSDTLKIPNSIVSNIIANTLNLFTTHTGTINYGNSAIVQSYIKAKSVLFGNFSIGTSIGFFMSSLTSVTCSFYGDNANPTVTTANIQATRSATTPLVTNSGDLTISCGNMNLIADQLYTPQKVAAIIPSAVVNLYTDQTNNINLGGSGINIFAQSPISVNEIQCYSNSNIDYKLWFNSTATDELYIGNYDIANTSNVNVGAGDQIINIGQNSARTASINIGSATSSSNVIVMGGTNTLVTIGGIAQITLGVAGGTLQTPRTFTTSAPGNALQLWTAQTGNINLGSTGQIRLPNTIVSGNTGTALSLYTTQLGAITMGNIGGNFTQNTNTYNSISNSCTITSTTLTLAGTTNIISGTTTNLNSTTTNLNSTTINLGGASTTALNIGEQMKPTYGSYNASTGTNVVDTIGYIYNGTPTHGALTNNAFTTIDTITLPIGVYSVSATQTYSCTTAGNCTKFQLGISNAGNTDYYCLTGVPTTSMVLSQTYWANVAGFVVITTASTDINLTTTVQGACRASTTALYYKFQALRIA